MVILLKFIKALFSSVPLSWSLGLGRFVGWFANSVVRHRRREVEDRIMECLELDDRGKARDITRRMYRHLGMVIAEVFWYSSHPNALNDRVEVETEENMKEALARGKGALILMGHIGNWELLGFMAQRLNYDVAAVVKTLRNPAADEFWAGIRKQLGLAQLPSKNSIRPCLRRLRDKKLVAMILDQNMRAVSGVFVDFFGRPACTTPGLAIMSAQSGAPVVPVIIVRLPGGRHRLRFLPPLDPPASREEDEILAHTARYTKILENAIREHPEQWIWLHRRWRTKPEEADSTPPLA